MPIARFQMPDGRIGRFEVPDGTTPEAAQAMIEAHVGGKPAGPDVGAAFAQGQAHTLIPGAQDASASPDVPKSPSRLAGLPGAALTMASAIPATIVGNVGGALSRAGGASMTDAGKRAKDIAGKLTYEPSPAGGAALKTIGHAFDESKLAGLNPAMALPTLFSIRPALAGAENSVRSGAGSLATKLAAQRESKAAIAAPRANILNAAADANLTTLPADTNPTLLNRILQGWGGKAQTQQKVSLQNAPVANKMAQERFGVEEPLTPSAINPATNAMEGPMLDVRREAHERGYVPVKSLGQIPGDEQAFAELDALTSRGKNISQGFPNSEIATDAVTPLVDGLKQSAYDSGALVDMISVLREEAGKAFAGRDKSMGNAYKGAANALENMIERHLEGTGQLDTLANFRDARKTIAQSHVVEPTLTPGGNVNVQALAERGKKAPLTDELKVLSDFGREQPKAVQPVGRIGGDPLGSPLDLGVNLLSGKPETWLATMVGRPAIRAAITSPWYQKHFVRAPDYAQPGLIERIAGSVAGEGPKPPPTPMPGAAIPAVDFASPSIPGMKAGNLSLGERGPFGNEIDIGPFRQERALAGASNVEAAQSTHTARMADEATRVPYEPPSLIKEIADRLGMAASPRPALGNELDMGPFSRDRALTGAGNVEELVRRIDELSRTAPQAKRTYPPASLEHNLQWLQP